MACGCSKNKTNVQNSANPLVPQNVQQIITNEKLENFVEVIYNGSDRTHVIGSPSGVIAKFGMRNYGSGKKGDVIWVHEDDIKKSPFLYTKVQTMQEFLKEKAYISDEEEKEFSLPLEKNASDVADTMAIETLEKALPENKPLMSTKKVKVKS